MSLWMPEILLKRANALIAANPYTPYAYVAQNADVERQRAEKYARTLLLAALAATTAEPVAPEGEALDEWKIPNAHLHVLQNIQAGLGAWHGAERPKQRGFRSGLLLCLKTHGLIDWTMEGQAARYFVTEAGAAALAAPPPSPQAAVATADERLTADMLWNSSEVMALNAELGLSMDQLLKLSRAIGALHGTVKPDLPWPSPLTKVQVTYPDGTSMMLAPERAYFDAATVQEIVNAQRAADRPALAKRCWDAAACARRKDKSSCPCRASGS